MLIIVSIHAPREGCDHRFLLRHFAERRFQFTHPGRGATELGSKRYGMEAVSIHAPREGCDALGDRIKFGVTCFNSRTPGGVRPASASAKFFSTWVSIHAPREGCDNTFRGAKQPYSEFQFTHPGRGATIVELFTLHTVIRFNSRTPGGVRRQRRH